MKDDIFLKDFNGITPQLMLCDRVCLGMLDLKACIMYLNCTRVQYQKDYDIFCYKKVSRGHMRTFFHELTHYFQLMTTTNGFYITVLEDFQIEQIRQMLFHLNLEAKTALGHIRFPIINYMIRYQPYKKNPLAWYHLRKWYAAELLKARFINNFSLYSTLISPTIFSTEKLCDIFNEIDYEMSNNFKTQSFRQKISYRNMLEISEASYDDDLDYVLQNGASPFENHAQMSEFWWNDAKSQNPFYDNSYIDDFKYTGWIHAFARRNHIDNFQNFVACFLAISELSQFAPVLPNLLIGGDTNRIREKSVYDLLPSYRMKKLINVSTYVKPIDNINDYNRYVDQLAEKAGYTPVGELCELILNNRHYTVGKSFWIDLFYESIRIRRDNFSTFFNYGLWHPQAFYVEPFSRYFTQVFTPPVICYIDSTFSRQNKIFDTQKFQFEKDEAFTLVLRNIFRNYLSIIMFGDGNNGNMDTVYIKCPINDAVNFEKLYIEYQINVYIRGKLGLVPVIKIM